MATKTISVDLEAYDHLRRAKISDKESFSQVIKRAVWPPRKGTAGQLLAGLVGRDAMQAELSEGVLNDLDDWQKADAAAPDRWAEDK